ncbi:PEGA domain-containing protein [Candidatus Daviesbacteria bacterium]|nr:PEGA domain-containing protein [Candidatus Daviesbacteria bacterium]
MKKVLVWILVFISIVAILLRFSPKLGEVFLGFKPTSGISILSEPSGAMVFLDNKEVGKTPYEDKNLLVKDYTVRLEKDQASWQGKIKLISGTAVIVERDLATDSASSAGEILTLEKGQGITVISNPADSDVEIDARSYGKTPQTFNIPSGDHTIVVTHPNYLSRSIKAVLPDNFNLTIIVDLALSEVDLSIISTPVITQTPQAIVKNTPTGFLRVRDKPSLLGKEVAQVKPADQLVLLEEAGDWYRVRLPNGVEGYVSSSYVEKKTD